MSNIISNRYDDLIGYYKDLKDYYKDLVQDYLNLNDYEGAKEMIEHQKGLDVFADYGGLLITSENNGFGWTVDKYRGEEED